MKLHRLFLALLSLVALFACEVNTMYNARVYFKQAQAQPLNNQGRPNAQAVENYTKTIKKCGIIITANKKGARLEDAYFLMAKALYYKGNSAFQAKDQFENILLLFPKSSYVPESHLFIARILREINQKKEAERRLDEFIRNPGFRRDHPKALFLMADFAIKDKDYIKAQYYLERIIKEYPKTQEYREAYFLFGKNYFEQKDFARSLEAFEKMQNARRIDKLLKLDGRYYIGLNQLELGQTTAALKTAKSLVKNETRADKIPQVRLLKARVHFALGDSTAAKTEIDYITKNNPRTESAAGAYYYLAEHQYYKTGDAAKAVANYNRVRTEFSASPLATEGQNKATALGKVTPPANLNSETNLNQFLDHHYLAAESFLGALALPDSAMARYRKVINEKSLLQTKLDSLAVQLDTTLASLDSLILSDSLAALASQELQYPVTSMSHKDSLVIELDSLAVAAPMDSLVAMADSLGQQSAVVDSLALARRQQRDDLNSQKNTLEARQKTLEEAISRFDDEIIPFCLFAIGSVLKDHYPDSPQNLEVLGQLKRDYPENKYSKALEDLQAGRQVRLIDLHEERQEARLDSLFGQITTAPDSAVAGLKELVNSEFSGIKLAANYRLGWYYSFESIDTLQAVPYLKAVLDDPKGEDYATLTRRFYNGNNFLLRDLPDAEVIQIDSLSAVGPGSLQTWRFPTPAIIYPSLPDSLQHYRGIPPLVDSLSQQVSEPVSTPNPELGAELKDPELEAPKAVPDIIKEETELE